jgi:hypothetical protein
MLHRARIVLAEEGSLEEPVIKVLHHSYDASDALKVFNENAGKFPEVVMIEHCTLTRRRLAPETRKSAESSAELETESPAPKSKSKSKS